jgi:hypothetical protein
MKNKKYKKQKILINLFVFVMVLSIPFALSSQTRKAIPSGRYESLSGAKTSKSSKNEIKSGQNTQLLWQEVLKNFDLSNRGEILFHRAVSNAKLLVIPQRGFKEIKSSEANYDVLISDNPKIDPKLTKNLKSKGLIVLVSSNALKEMMPSLSSYDLLMYQSEGVENYYLLKLK